MLLLAQISLHLFLILTAKYQVKSLMIKTWQLLFQSSKFFHQNFHRGNSPHCFIAKVFHCMYSVPKFQFVPSSLNSLDGSD